MQEGNEKVTVTVVSFTQEEYESRLKEALESDSGGKPDLYESTGVSEDITDSDAEPLDAVISSSEFKSCELLKKTITNLQYKKRMPLAVNLPVAYMFGKVIRISILLIFQISLRRMLSPILECPT